jgi:hypothetical protein
MTKASSLRLRHLEGKHQRLDIELGELMNRAHMTPAEYQQAAVLKKRKLLVKDDIMALRQVMQR